MGQIYGKVDNQDDQAHVNIVGPLLSRLYNQKRFFNLPHNSEDMITYEK